MSTLPALIRARALLVVVAPFALAVALPAVHLACADPSDSGDDDNERRDEPVACVPTTCAELGLDCGDALDGCDHIIACGTCADTETCGAAGPNVCGVGTCTVTTCADALATCGLISDNCAAVLTCGTCDEGEVCSSPDSGARACCTPTHTCDSENAECGVIDDGCGNDIACGSCGTNETCGADGPNQCGVGSCEPRSCDDVDAECGGISDGCESTLDCGECPGYLVCGALDDNRCGAVCANDCPNGYSCDDLGVCDGGALTGLVLDVDVPAFVAISGTVTMNGGPVQLPADAGPDAYGCADISFANLSGGESASATACSYDDWSYSVQLYVGHYRITVVDNYYGPTMLTAIPFEVFADRNVTAAGAIDLDVDVPAFVPVHGTVTMNGGDIQLPADSGPDAYGCVDISFTNLSGGESASATACSYDDWSYSVQLYVGHYRITVVDNYYGPTMLTAIPFEVFADRNVTAAAALNLDVEVPAFVPVHGTVTMNGGDVQLPANVGPDAYGCADISFENLSGGESASATACSYDDWRYDVQLYVGHYRITVVDNYYGPTMLTSIPFEVFADRNVTAASTLDLDVDVPAFVPVQGTVTMNGGDVELPANVGPDAYGCADISFTNLSGGESASATACSYDDWSYSVQLYVGHYRVTVVDNYYGPTMLTAIPFEVFADRNVTAASTLDLDVDVPAFVPVHGTVTMNGGPVQLPANVGPDAYGCADISFENLSGGESASATACSYDDWRYDVQLYVGHYRISVVDNYYGPTMLTSIPFEVFADKNVTSAGAVDLDVDVPAFVGVQGTVTMNGGVIQLPADVGPDAYGCVDIAFTNLEGGESAGATACSYDGWAYSVQVYAGIYRVTVVDNYYGPTMLTGIPQTVVERVRFGG